MDYTTVPMSLIYKKRDNLKDFGVTIPGTINHYLFTQMREMTLLHTDGAKEIALQCFNNAYYICTLIQFEEFPDLCVDKYEKKLLEVKIPFCEDVCAASMGMVCELLPAYDAKWKIKDNVLIRSIYRWFSHNKWMNSYARKSFDNIVSTCNTDGFILPKSEFAPRDIIEAIETLSEEVLVTGVEYVCEALERLVNPQQREYGADMAIARLRDHLRELNEIYETGPAPRDYDIPYHLAIEYIENHYPKLNKNDASIQTGPVDENSIAIVDQQPEISRHSPDATILQERIKVLDNEIICLQKVISETQSEKEKVSAENKQLKEENKYLYDQLQPNEELYDEKKLGIDERVIFVSTAMGLTLDKADTNQSQLAHFISNYSGDYWKSIRSRIVNINIELAQERKTPGYGLSNGTKDAVKNVKEWLKKVGRVIAPATESLIKEIDDIYLNKKE